jgi:3-hydroxypropanoate dehydrogenase
MLSLDGQAQDLLFRTARTASKFASDPVSDEQIRAIYELVKWGPTSANSQPLRVVVARSEQAKARLIPHLSEGNRAKSASAPVVLVLAADLDYHLNLGRLLPYLDNPAKAHEDPAFRHPNAEFNAAIQAGYVILGIRAAGLAAGPMLGFDKDAMTGEFFSGQPRKAILVINVGHPAPDAWLQRLPRLEADEVITFL